MDARKLHTHYAAIVSTIALIVALTGAGAYAVQHLGKNTVGPKQIKRNAVRAKHIKRGAVGPRQLRRVGAKDIARNAVKPRALAADAVRTRSIADGAVTTQAIGDDQVQAVNLDLPEPTSFSQEQEVSKVPAGEWVEMASFTYQKVDADSALRVDWSGAVAAGGLPCFLQLRVDGREAAARGTVYVDQNATLTIATATMFTGLAAGAHEVQIWAKADATGTGVASCSLSPAEVGIGQSLTVEEVVS